MPIIQDHFGAITELLSDHYGTQQYFAPNGEMVSIPLYKLVGDVFGGTVLDPEFWTASLGTGGTATNNTGELVMSTGTTANNSVMVTSVRTARFSGLAPNKIRIVVQLSDSGIANNIRRGGVFTATDGAFFELDGTTFNLVRRKGSVDTRITNGLFNGQWGPTYSPGLNSHFYEIIWQPRQIVWLADQKIIHTFNAAAGIWTNTMHLPIRLENTNSGGSTTNVSMSIRNATVARFGIQDMQPVGVHIDGAVTRILKYGPGNLHGVAVNSNTGTRIILYDGLDASGVVIASINPNQLTTLDYKKLTFSTGLTVVSTGSTVDCTIMFE